MAALFHVTHINYALVTAYCLRGGMASGNYVYDGAVAVDPNYYRLSRKYHHDGTIIRIGKRKYIAEDTGGAIVGPGRFDIWMSSCRDAINFGVQRLPYQIIKK